MHLVVIKSGEANIRYQFSFLGPSSKLVRILYESPACSLFQIQSSYMISCLCEDPRRFFHLFVIRRVASLGVVFLDL